MARPATPITATCTRTFVVFEFPTVAAAARHLLTEEAPIHNCVHGFQRQHKGYTFRATGQIPPHPGREKVRKVADLLNQGFDISIIALDERLSLATVRKYIKQAKVKGWIK